MSRILSWLVELPLPVWLVPVGLFAVWPAVAFLPINIELKIRLYGTFLQFLAIGAVALGLRDIRKLFGLPSFFNRLRFWMSRPPWRREIPSGAGTIPAIGRSSGAGQASLMTVDSAAPVSEQLNALREVVKVLEGRITKMETSLKSEFSEGLRQEKRIRMEADNDIRSLLETAKTGGLDITVTGLIWLFAGVLLATLSPEITAWIT